ncbi:MAG: hypothetical protein PHQ94_05430 [Syntrophomonas sp.]|nr:hypothetical protein [Syntrophomonas sp.]
MQQNNSPRVLIILGGFGSGKSEYAINLALQTAAFSDLRSALVDLDLVNAYFRSREVRALLESHGIEAVVPPDNIMFSDLPIAGPGIGALIKDTSCRVILDVGGDDIGATALGTYREEILSSNAGLYMVVNPFRPFTNTMDNIIRMKTDIEYSSGLTVNSLISNPNIGPGTGLQQIIDKHRLVKEAGQHMNLPVSELLVLEDLYHQHSQELDSLGTPVRPLTIHLLPTWLLKQQKEDMKRLYFKV